MPRIILTSEGTEGDISPVWAIAQALARRGHRVSLVTHHVFLRRFQADGFEVHALDGGEAHAAFLGDCEGLNDPRTATAVFRDHFLPWARSGAAMLQSLVEPGADALLVTNATPGIAARLVAAARRLPLVTLCTYPDNLRTASLVEHLVCDRLGQPLTELAHRHGLGADPRSWWRTPAAQLALWPRWFCDARSLGDCVQTGFCWTDRADAHDDLPASLPGDVLITGGSATLAGAHFVEAAVRGCDLAGMRALLVSQHFSPPPASAVAHRRAIGSMTAAIARARIVIHHGGMGTIGQCIGAGRPQLILAHGGDRPFNARLVQSLGAGIALPRNRWTGDDVATALRGLLRQVGDAPGAANVANAFDPHEAIERSCDVIEQVAARTRPLTASETTHAHVRAEPAA